MVVRHASRTAAQYWADCLAAWAIPDEIMKAAPKSPGEFSTKVFAQAAQRALAGERHGPSEIRALEALPPGGTVLDVGVGGGAGCLPLAPPAGLLIGLDSSRALLDVFAEVAGVLGVAHREVLGSWPDAAPEVESADVVVCHHVLYNVADAVPFAMALTDHARRRVVLEISAEHPMASSNHLWKAIHGIDRPTSPTADDAITLLAEAGLDIRSERSLREPRDPVMDRGEIVAHARQRLCVGPERDAEIDALLPPDAQLTPRRVVTIWWDGRG